MSNTNEYSGTDTLDRRITNTYLNQYNYANNVSNVSQINNNNGNTVGYSSTKELGIIRTNLNNWLFLMVKNYIKQHSTYLLTDT